MSPLIVGNAIAVERDSSGAPPSTTSSWFPGRGGVVAARRPGSHLALTAKVPTPWLRRPAGEIRKINARCYATVGKVGNVEHMNVVSGRSRPHPLRWPVATVRGMCMNPIDHPNGGGEGRSKSGGGGRQHLLSPWGHAKGEKTRNEKKASSRLIVQRRKAK